MPYEKNPIGNYFEHHPSEEVQSIGGPPTKFNSLMSDVTQNKKPLDKNPV